MRLIPQSDSTEALLCKTPMHTVLFLQNPDELCVVLRDSPSELDLTRKCV